MSSEFTSAPSDSGLLAAYGWNASLDAAFADHRAAGLLPCRVTGVDRGRCDVVTDHGPVRAVSTPVLSPDPVRTVCVGDWGALRPRTGEPPLLTALLPRRSAIVRSTASARSEGQVLAANVDTAAVVEPLTGRVSPARVERLLALAWESGTTPVVVLTKADRHPAPGRAAAETAAVAPGADVVAVSAATGDGLDALTALLRGTVVLLGPSGAGKSTLVNTLLGADVLATGEVRDRDGKGRHTTVRRDLLPLGDGRVLMTPPGCAGWGCGTPPRGCTAPSPRSGNSPRSAASTTAPTRANRAARCWPPSTAASCRSAAWTATAHCCGRTSGRPRAATPACAPRSAAGTGRAPGRCASSTGCAAGRSRFRPAPGHRPGAGLGAAVARARRSRPGPVGTGPSRWCSDGSRAHPAGRRHRDDAADRRLR